MTVTSRTLCARLRSRLQFFTQPDALPLALLLLALSTVFLFGNNRGHFYRPIQHDECTSQHLAQAVNLSPQHNFLPFLSKRLNTDGEPSYVIYERWPIGSYVLAKLATLPFRDDLSAQIYAVRVLMLFFYSGSVLLAYTSFTGLVGRWVALIATLTTFSSHYSLYYNDMYAPDAGPGLFGFMLTFHGMVIFAQERRFWQLLVKACVALLLCWQVYALLFSFIVFGLVRDIIKVRRSFSISPCGIPDQLKRYGSTLLAGRYSALAIVTLFFGSVILLFNIANAYFALNEEVDLLHLPLFYSLDDRLFGGSVYLDADSYKHLKWDIFLLNEFYRIGRMALPVILSPFENKHVGNESDVLLAILGGLGLAICLLGIIFSPHKLLLGTFVVSGFCWTLPLRYHTISHDFTALFYLGVPLIFLSFIFLYIQKFLGQHFISTCALASLFLFILSSAEMAGPAQNSSRSLIEAQELKDFETIRKIVREGVVYIPRYGTGSQLGRAQMLIRFFLAGSTVEFETFTFWPRDLGGQRQLAEFLILRTRNESPALLTPENRQIFLYDRILLDAFYDEKLLGNPIVAGDYQVYLRDNSLIYVGTKCRNEDPPLFLHVVPSDVAVLQKNRKGYGFDNMDFPFAEFSVMKTPKCIAVRKLPQYDIMAIHTGQYTAKGPLWEGTYLFGDSRPDSKAQNPGAPVGSSSQGKVVED